MCDKPTDPMAGATEHLHIQVRTGSIYIYIYIYIQGGTRSIYIYTGGDWLILTIYTHRWGLGFYIQEQLSQYTQVGTEFLHTGGQSIHTGGG